MSSTKQKDLNKINLMKLLQKIIAITIIQLIIFAIFILVDKRFMTSLISWFFISLVISFVILIIAHLREAKIDDAPGNKSSENA
ncbi:MAG: hypothetical protein ACTSVI_08645 [Promethearchaeota archaeon]